MSGADPIEARPGFAVLLDRIEDNGIRIVSLTDTSDPSRIMMRQVAGAFSEYEKQRFSS